MSRHSWETRAHSWERADTGDLDPCWNDCSDSDLEPDEPDTAGAHLVKKLLSLYIYNKVSAEDCCVSCFWAAEAGVVEAKPYGMRPGGQSGHYARKLNGKLGFANRELFYTLDVPGHSKHDLSRTVHTIGCIPGHEQLADDLAGDPTCRNKLQELLRDYH